MLFTQFLPEDNVLIAVVGLFRAMFPDSEIAKKYGSGRTKTNVLVETLAIED